MNDDPRKSDDAKAFDYEVFMSDPIKRSKTKLYLLITTLLSFAILVPIFVFLSVYNHTVEISPENAQLFTDAQTRCGKNPVAVTKSPNVFDGGYSYSAVVASAPPKAALVGYYCSPVEAAFETGTILYVNGKRYDPLAIRKESYFTGSKYAHYAPTEHLLGFGVEVKLIHQQEGYTIKYYPDGATTTSNTLYSASLDCDYGANIPYYKGVQELGSAQEGYRVIKLDPGANQFVSLRIYLPDTICHFSSTTNIPEADAIKLVKSIRKTDAKTMLTYDFLGAF